MRRCGTVWTVVRVLALPDPVVVYLYDMIHVLFIGEHEAVRHSALLDILLYTGIVL
jgi:hypothetical protein